MGYKYGFNFGGGGLKGLPEFDIDTLKYNAGWMCVFYSGSKKLAETKHFPTQKAAEEEIVLKIMGLPSSDRPNDLNKGIVWNSVQYRDFKAGGGLNGGSYIGSTTTTYSHCDHDPDEVGANAEKLLKNSPFSIGKVAIIGATKAKIQALPAKRKKRRLIVNCSGSSISTVYVPKPIEKPFTTVPKGFEGLFKQSYAWLMPEVAPKLFYGDEVVVDWPDGKAAPIHPSFWVDLLAKIQDEQFQAKYADVVFCCFGGHGRTGTALASLAIVAGIYAAKGVTFKNDKARVPTLAEKAEVWIQHEYCKKAIESDDQSEYLACVEEFYLSTHPKTEVTEVV